MSDSTKQCPFCAETIQAAAVVCRYCGRDLVAPASPAPHKIRNGGAYQCSECKGYVRPEATECKHCKAVLNGPAETRTVDSSPVRGSSAAAYILVTLVLLGGLGWLLGLFGSGVTTTPGTVPAGPSSSYQVTYRVGGNATHVSLTYNNAQGGTEQKEAPLPWATAFSARSIV